MKLDVLTTDDGKTWYADGLNFTCTQCGNCCTGGPGFVWISDVEITRLAEHLKMTEQAVKQKYCRMVSGRLSLKERKTPEGNYDCIFLKAMPATAPEKGELPQTRKYCSVYTVRPLQCRTWPFWSGNLATPAAWDRAAERCHGMNAGRRHFPLQQIEQLRDAVDWPQKPPTSS